MNYTTPAMDKVCRAIARTLVDAFEKGELAAVYERANAIAPKLYPARSPLRSKDLDKVTDLLADAFLIVKDRV